MKVLVFDTETTGLIFNHTLALDRQAEVIEYYGVLADLSTGEVFSDVEHIIQPREYPMKDKTIKDTKTKLSNELLLTAPRFQTVAEDIRRQLEDAPVVIAHNLAFDKEMMDLEFERLKKRLIWPRNLICSVEQTVHLQGKRMTLTALHTFLFNEGFPEAHRAKNDVTALLRCCFELYKRDLL